MKYFDHDTNASDDDKIMALRLDAGGAAVDAYWCILELIYRDETDLVLSENQPKTKALTHRLCVGFDQLREWVSEMVSVGLLVVVSDGGNEGENETVYRSPRAASNIDSYSARKETARQNGKKGGRKPRGNQTLTKSVSKTKPDENQPETKPKAKEKEKVLVTHKGLPNTSASSVAAAAKAAPPAADDTVVPRCPQCGGTMRYDPSERLWRCKDGECRATVKPHELERCFAFRDDPDPGKTRPHCPLCGSLVEPPMVPGSPWDCPICGQIKEDSVKWVKVVPV